MGKASVLSPADERAVSGFISRMRAVFGRRLVRAVLFGSKARGEGDDSSDIDILLVVEGMEPRDRRAASRAAWEAGISEGAVLCAHCYSADEFERQRRLPFLATVLKEGISL